MRWGDMRPSDNVEDRRGSSGGPRLGGGMRLSGGALVVVVIVGLVFGVNPLQFLGMMEGAGPAVAPSQPATPAGTAPAPAAKDPEGALVRRTLGDTEDVWTALLEGMGTRYEPPRLVLFAGSTPSACGQASTAAGPFYCPADRKVYLDTAFFGELSRKFGAPGDFAAAYVIAHEIGHHVQNQLGTMRKFDQAAARMDTRERNALSVRLELQADCYAGVWGFYAAKRNLLEPGDVEEGLRAASAVGDDTIQQRARGHVVPDAFTHGSADQRVRWFRTGLASGDPRKCNTFAGKP